MTGRLLSAILAATAAVAQTPAELMNQPAIRAAFEAARRNEPAILELQAKVCEIPAPPFKEEVRAKDYATLSIDVRVLPGQVNDLGDVALPKGFWVAGRILDETGAGAKYTIRFDACERDGRVAPNFGTIWSFPTKSDGSFRVTGLAPGFHRLEVMSEGDERTIAECVAVFDVREGPVENARLTVTNGVPFVLDPDGKHGPDARFAVLDEAGVRVLSRLVPDAAPMRFRLAPGRYTVEFKSAREDPAPRTVPVELIRDPVVVTMR